MSAQATLAAIARGERPSGLLQTCRLMAAGVEHYGIEAVSAQFQRSPLDLSQARWASDEHRVAAVCPETVLAADAYGPNIARIWRVGAGQAMASEARIDVPFDADMAQARGRVFGDAEDLPGLGAHEIARIGDALGRELDRWTVEGAVASRARAFPLRGVAGEGLLVCLVAIHALAASERHTARFVHAALVIEGDTPRLVRDVAGEATDAAIPWTPRAA